jgi:hypothetical protein
MKRTSSGNATTRKAASPTLIFLHIPRTGGMTMRKIIERNYLPAERCEVNLHRGEMHPDIPELTDLTDDRKRDLRMVYGHTIFGVHDFLPGPAAYVTMLRQPRAIVLSAYDFLARRKGEALTTGRARQTWMHQRIGEMTLEEYARSEVAREGDNLQTRMIAGDFSWSASCTEETLEQAKRNIDQHFISVGLTERFDETLLLWGEKLGWRKLHYVPRNVSRRPGPSLIPGDVVRLIEEHNEFDTELYRFAKARLEEELAEYRSMDRDVARFRWTNSLYRRLTVARPRRILGRIRAAVG